MTTHWLVSEFDRFLASKALGATRYRSTDAVFMLTAIAVHESGLRAFQLSTSGFPLRSAARGLWQFEIEGVRSVVRHDAAYGCLEDLDHALAWRARIKPEQVWAELPWDPVAAMRIARALLWSVPEPLPRPNLDEEKRGWQQYLTAWNPGAREETARRRWRSVWSWLLKQPIP